jgi:outer membrane protein X
MKRIIVMTLITLAVANGYSQEKGKFRVGLDLGFVPSGGGGGVMFSLEPKYNIKDNMNIGLRFGAAAIIKDLNTNVDSPSAKVSASGSYVGTYDYYFHKSGSSFAPYVGGGFGYYSLANIEVDESAGGSPNTEYSPAVSGAFGGLIRGGFEWAGFRMGIEYNLVPDSDLEDVNGNVVGTAKNAYLGIHIGFFVGGGKWGK